METLNSLANHEFQLIFIPLIRNLKMPFHSISVGLVVKKSVGFFYGTYRTRLTFSGARDTTPLQLDEKGYFLDIIEKCLDIIENLWQYSLKFDKRNWY